jgi:hypothetical protein
VGVAMENGLVVYQPHWRGIMSRSWYRTWVIISGIKDMQMSLINWLQSAGRRNLTLKHNWERWRDKWFSPKMATWCLHFSKNMDKIFSTMGFVYPKLRKSRKPADERVLCFKWGNGNVESHPGTHVC